MEHLPVLTVVVPLMAAPVAVVLRRPALAMGFGILAAWATFGLALLLLGRVLAEGTVSYALGNWPPPIGIEYRIDALAAFVMAFVSGLGAVCLTYAPASCRVELPERQRPLFPAMFLLCLTGLLGIVATGDLFNVYVFLEISSLSSYVLIGLGRRRRALMAAFEYLILGTIGATFILVGIGLLYMITGTLNMADLASRLGRIEVVRTELVAFGFLTVGLSLKIALFPLHLWLPNAYTYAPSVVTAFLAATATKVSIYLLARLIFSIFGTPFAFATMHLDKVLLVLALAALFAASGVAIYQTNVKRMLAFSSLAQIGYMILGLSLGTVTGLTGGLVHLFNHALAKGGLFLALGAVACRTRIVDLDHMRGLGRQMPWTMAAWMIGALSLIGVPGTAGFISKWYLATGALERNWWPVVLAVLGSSLLAAIYVWRVVEAAWFAEPPEDRKPTREVSLALLAPMWLLAGATLWFGFATEYSAGVAHKAAEVLLGVAR